MFVYDARYVSRPCNLSIQYVRRHQQRHAHQHCQENYFQANHPRYCSGFLASWFTIYCGFFSRVGRYAKRRGHFRVIPIRFSIQLRFSTQRWKCSLSVFLLAPLNFTMPLMVSRPCSRVLDDSATTQPMLEERSVLIDFLASASSVAAKARRKSNIAWCAR